MRLVFFGMEGVFSRVPLAALLAAGGDVCAVVVPRPHGLDPLAPARFLPPPPAAPDLPLLSDPFEPNIMRIAWNAGIPVLEVGRLDRAARDLLAALAPDLICVACFPLLLPPSLLALPRHGALNLHPSLLPDYRGPAPLFWIFHDGLEHAGVTLHWMDAGADTGDIVAQTPVALPDGIGFAAAERVLAEQGGALWVAALRGLDAHGLSRRPQPPGPHPRAPFPTQADFVVTPEWSARRAYNFLRGLSGDGPPLWIRVGSDMWQVRAALSFDEHSSVDEPVTMRQDTLTLRGSPGTLTCWIQARPGA